MFLFKTNNYIEEKKTLWHKNGGDIITRKLLISMVACGRIINTIATINILRKSTQFTYTKTATTNWLTHNTKIHKYKLTNIS